MGLGSLGRPRPKSTKPQTACQAAAARSLADAIATGPAADRLPGAVVVVRPAPRPALGLLGRIPAKERAWLGAAVQALGGTVDRIRRVDWSDVEEAAEEAATALSRRMGRDRLTGAAIRGIPRGGMVAAGLLAYALDLPRMAFDRNPAETPLTILVDDCALSGARFREELNDLAAPTVVFAPLFSVPAFRDALETVEDRVAACVSGRDLVDHAPRQLGSEYGEWQESWRRRSADALYWVGQPDHLVFPWSEPDATVWDRTREEEARGFSVTPPGERLSSREADKRLDVQVQPRGRGPLRPSPCLLWGRMDDRVVIRDPAAPRALVLEGTAADMWTALVRVGEPGGAARWMAERYEAPLERIEADLRELVRGLQERDVLVDEASQVSPGRSAVTCSDSKARP